MNEVVKDIVLWCSGFEGFFKDNNKFVGLRIGKEVRDVLHHTLLLVDKLKNNVSDKDLDKLAKEIECGLINACVLKDFEKHQNKKRMGSMTAKVNKSALDDLGELIIWKMCGDCDKKKKNCKVRTTMLKLELCPPCHLP